MSTFGKDLMKNLAQREEAEDLDRREKTNFLSRSGKYINFLNIKKNQKSDFYFSFSIDDEITYKNTNSNQKYYRIL